MSESTHPQKSQAKGAKGLGRGLGSLLGPTNEGAFSKTTPATDKTVQALTEKMPGQADPAIQQGFIETKASHPMTTQAPLAAVPAVPAHLRIWQIPIEKIDPNPNQPRQIFDKEPLQELANSIQEKGI